MMWSPFGNGSGGYVSKAQGWEFVPCSRLERAGRKDQSPARVRSFPTNILEHLPVGPAAASSGTARLEQHGLLQKQFEGLKKSHELEKDEWRMEKELLLRQVAEIQGGENRRILLDLKSVLEEVQSGVKREESERQHTRDRCAWELERSQLKSRISQLEVRGCSALMETGKDPEQGDTLKRERAEQKKLLEDLRCRLENSERGWLKEKSELLERFHSERKEWENQLTEMQQKIEELYKEVKARRTDADADPPNSPLRLSSCTLSSISGVSYSSDAQSNDYSDPLTQQSDGSADSSSRPSNQSSQSRLPCHCALPNADDNHAVDTAELEEILDGCLNKTAVNRLTYPSQDELLYPFQGFQSMEITCGSGKKNNTALNAALQEIARVSEELCSFHDELGKWPEVKRSQSAMVERVTDSVVNEEPIFNLKKLSEEIQSLDEQYWMNWQEGSSAGRNHPGDPPPPVPARSTSWYLCSLSPSELQSGPSSESSSVDPSPASQSQKPGSQAFRNHNSPAIVRKFEALLEENEGKSLRDLGIIAAGPGQKRWSCDESKLKEKLFQCKPFKKCLSNTDIASLAEEDHSPATGLPLNMTSVSAHLRFTSLQKNERLEQKTADFNRTLFQADMELRCEEEPSSGPLELSVRSDEDLTSTPLEEEPVRLDSAKAVTSENETRFCVSSSVQVDVVQPNQDDTTREVLFYVQNDDDKPPRTQVGNHKPFNCLVPGCSEVNVPLPQCQRQRNTPEKVGADQLQTEEKSKQARQGRSNTRSRLFDENPWKPWTLAAYPRPPESKSNYGAIERILKSYEDLDQSQEQQQHSLPSTGEEDDLMELLNVLEKPHQSASVAKQTHTPHKPLVETHVSVQQSKVTVQKAFSRPACPAKRRLPSRWASHSPSSPMNPTAPTFTHHSETVV